MDDEDLTHKLDLLRILKRRFQILEKREAQYGLGVDPGVTIEREDLAKQIKVLEQAVTRASVPSITHSPIRGLMNSTVILDVSRIIDTPLPILEYHLGDPVETMWRGLQSAADIPDGGATREYHFDDYAIWINYTKSGIATGVHLFEGLEAENYSFNDWPIILPRIGLLHVINLPDTRGLTTITWRNYQGLTISIASQRVGGPITAVRVYKLLK
ncbi:MAG: hypothetical protein GFH27_549347n43 [Chloroflexi bacterium AL-W]|nr:hypothetical protein [Chloroflexi bacterium AL-N1]NOK70825.1 hypothetical protein [Chloroflexi bacterium AL-N10]NOK78385.1 hypothetical protein [Chloroflexi bacterium AL-N5]NOK85366.1 hypothetical protein [Chloroflexi bacterium AL-W]NOK92642.1 hypothetical protein [Chloroflexi bacterium AL-N15]